MRPWPCWCRESKLLLQGAISSSRCVSSLYMNCSSHLFTSITVMIAQVFGSHYLLPTLPSPFPHWHPLQHHDAASLTAATKVAEGAFKRCKCVCVHDYAGNKGLRVTGFNNGKCEARERWETGLLSTIATIRLCPHKNKKHTHGWLLEHSDELNTCSKKAWHTWRRRCEKWMELWTLKC